MSQFSNFFQRVFEIKNSSESAREKVLAYIGLLPEPTVVPDQIVAAIEYMESGQLGEHTRLCANMGQLDFVVPFFFAMSVSPGETGVLISSKEKYLYWKKAFRRYSDRRLLFIDHPGSLASGINFLTPESLVRFDKFSRPVKNMFIDLNNETILPVVVREALHRSINEPVLVEFS